MVSNIVSSSDSYRKRNIRSLLAVIFILIFRKVVLCQKIKES
nr:MAG TPA: hypothetical protein [Bacteriophage sp.]